MEARILRGTIKKGKIENPKKQKTRLLGQRYTESTKKKQVIAKKGNSRYSNKEEIKRKRGTSLAVQWLVSLLLLQGASLIRELGLYKPHRQKNWKTNKKMRKEREERA